MLGTNPKPCMWGEALSCLSPPTPTCCYWEQSTEPRACLWSGNPVQNRAASGPCTPAGDIPVSELSKGQGTRQPGTSWSALEPMATIQWDYLVSPEIKIWPEASLQSCHLPPDSQGFLTHVGCLSSPGPVASRYFASQSQSLLPSVATRDRHSYSQ